MLNLFLNKYIGKELLFLCRNNNFTRCPPICLGDFK